jgi:hypothetical protein
MTTDYIPKSEGQLTIWLTNFKTKLGTHGGTLGLGAAEITALENSCDALIAQINAVEAAKTALSNAVQTKDAGKATTIDLLRTEVARMKTNGNYTKAIGEDMSIIGENLPPDLNAMKPGIGAEAFPGYVRIKFTKKGFTGVNIYTRIKGNVGWLFLSRDTNSPYDDHRPLTDPNTPETREYMAIGLKNDDEIGQQSDIVPVVFGG